MNQQSSEAPMMNINLPMADEASQNLRRCWNTNMAVNVRLFHWGYKRYWQLTMDAVMKLSLSPFQQWLSMTFFMTRIYAIHNQSG